MFGKESSLCSCPLILERVLTMFKKFGTELKIVGPKLGKMNFAIKFFNVV